ncbi:alkylation response protein AidB-like acyl-CoA dehydrogenase [Kibdelosporangium banguiense]|uniref:Alkylation response protein AidB-like acyl-CoA dehydrogenase n=1 Tax=Kibdelosporangium banguiense TaxID=1365924 RepID=A0ABS4TXJ5_9PSEU|nr:acyl-CoA dehydrogenase family protein [Kibdelosporangium banguiense]MBP2328661.1 alkylation response protein AidB-like acyl-CoA dehydrogenase [Kibdelosporangium banguiense]
MDFGWTDTQRALRERTRDRVRTSLAGEPGPFDRARWRLLGELGALGLPVAREHGGQGLGALDTAAVYEVLGEECADTGLVFAAAAHLFACVVPIAEFGDDAVRKQLLPGLCAGELIAANAMTETEAGSDVSAIEAVATEVPGGFVLNGHKSFASNGPVADVSVTYAVTDPAAGPFGLTAFAVDTASEGVRLGEPFDKLGMRGCVAGTVTFADCFVPMERVLGEPGQGAAIFQHSMGWERACLFALYLGVQDRLLKQCVTHARTRRQFGRPIGEFQAVSHRIAEMKLRLEAARLLVYRTCWAMDEDEPAGLHAALSKLAASEAALASATDAIRLLGGQGYLTGSGAEAAVRDALGGILFSGTTDVQRMLIATELGL